MSKIKFRLRALHINWLKGLIHLSALIPLFYTYFQAFNDQIGGDPVEAILHFTGISAFNLLLLSLLVSPVAKKLKQGMLINVRRLLGVYAFFYALAHFISYVLFELQMEWALLITEIIKRPYITVGFVALLLLTSMALSSTKNIQRKMGGKWQKLHNWVYVVALLIALHYIWSVKSDLIQPLIYWLMVLGLLWFRRDKLLRKLKNYKQAKQKKQEINKKTLA